MPLYKSNPEPSGRMGLLWTLGLIKDAAILEFGSMGHMLYAEKWLSQTGISERSKLFSTHLDEKDIALGITRRLENAVDEILRDKNFKAVFILPSSVPEMIGIDLGAICAQLEEKNIGVPVIPFGAGNFKAGKREGIEEAFYQLVRHFPKGKQKPLAGKKTGEAAGKHYNLIGTVCDTARFCSDAREITRIMKGAFGMEVISVLSFETSVEDLENMGEAIINLVIRQEGIKAAEEMKNKFGIPYHYGAPYGYQGTLDWIHSLEKRLGRKAEKEFLKQETKEGEYVLNSCKMWREYHKDKAKIWIEGQEDIARGMQRFVYEELGFRKEEGGILMSNTGRIKQNGTLYGIEIERTTDSCDYNLYQSPFMGFRGAMNLCSVWLKYLLD